MRLTGFRLVDDAEAAPFIASVLDALSKPVEPPAGTYPEPITLVRPKRNPRTLSASILALEVGQATKLHGRYSVPKVTRYLAETSGRTFVFTPAGVATWVVERLA